MLVLNYSAFLKNTLLKSCSLPNNLFSRHLKNNVRLTDEEILNIHKTNINPCLTKIYKNSPILSHGKMQYLWDTKGKRYLDFFGGIVTISVGHCHPKLVDALISQANKLWHVSSLYLYEEINKYAKDLLSKFPKHLNNVIFCNSGSEANELALLMTRLYTERHDIISLRNSYHGCLPNTMSLCGITTWKFPLQQTSGIFHTTCPDPYRGRYGGSNCRDSIAQTNRKCDCELSCKACDMYIEDLETVLNTVCPSKIAGFIAEGIQGVGGVVQFPKEYLKRAHEIIKKKDGLFIIDEVQSGFARLGSHYWAFEAHDILPDIVTMAKGIGNGFPLAAVVTRSEIAETMTKALFFNTFGGNPLATKIGSVVLGIIDDENLMENSQKMGNLLISGLCNLRDEFPDMIGDVRGKGLLIGLEMITNSKTQQPRVLSQIIEDLKDEGVLIGKGGPYGSVLRIKPPMCINKSDVEFALDKMRKVFFKNLP